MWSAPARAHRVPWGETPENCVCFRCMRWSLATVTATSTFGSQSRGASAKWPLSTCEITVERACKPGKWGKAEPNCTETKRATPSQPHMRQRELSLLLSLLHKTVFSFYFWGICIHGIFSGDLLQAAGCDTGPSDKKPHFKVLLKRKIHMLNASWTNADFSNPSDFVLKGQKYFRLLFIDKLLETLAPLYRQTG